VWLKKYKFTILFLIVCAIFTVIIYFKARINASYFVFLPGYRSGVSIEQIDNEELKSFFKIIQKFNDGSQFVVFYTILMVSSLHRFCRGLWNFKNGFPTCRT